MELKIILSSDEESFIISKAETLEKQKIERKDSKLQKRFDLKLQNLEKQDSAKLQKTPLINMEESDEKPNKYIKDTGNKREIRNIMIREKRDIKEIIQIRSPKEIEEKKQLVNLKDSKLTKVEIEMRDNAEDTNELEIAVVPKSTSGN